MIGNIIGGSINDTISNCISHDHLHDFPHSCWKHSIRGCDVFKFLEFLLIALAADLVSTEKTYESTANANVYNNKPAT